mgnify:CR=1 FL=1
MKRAPDPRQSQWVYFSEMQSMIWDDAAEALIRAANVQEHEEMTIQEALTLMDESVNASVTMGDSVVYPGLTAYQALRWVLEGFVASIKNKPQEMQVHPHVCRRIHQVCTNQIRPEALRACHACEVPHADLTIAALFFTSHPGNCATPLSRSPLRSNCLAK